MECSIAILENTGPLLGLRWKGGKSEKCLCVWKKREGEKEEGGMGEKEGEKENV